MMRALLFHQYIRHGVLWIVMGLLFTACKKSEVIREVGQPVNGPEASKGFGTSSTQSLSDQGPSIETIQFPSHWLDKNFILTLAESSIDLAPIENTKNTKLIFFKKNEKYVQVFEHPYGKSFTDQKKSEIFLGQFPIIDSSKKSIIVELKRGLEEILMLIKTKNKDDFLEEDYHIGRIIDSTIEENIWNDKWAKISLLLNLKVQQGIYRSSKFTFRFIPYEEKRHFNRKLLSKKMANERGVFRASEAIVSGQKLGKSPVIKIDTHKIIVYEIDPSVPDEYHSAIEEGVLYWNRIFDKEIFKVISSYEKIPDEGNKIIQNKIIWVPWDEKSFAFADSVADPASGMILENKIYLSSGLVQMSRKKGQRDLSPNYLKDLNNSEASHFFNELRKTKKQCLYEWDQLKFSSNALFWKNNHYQNILRAIVAHEVGHGLGLKHNFAGHLGGNIETPKEHQLALENVLKEKNDVKNEEEFMWNIGSTVMDYYLPEDALLMGRRIQSGPLPYDLKLIQWLYKGNFWEDLEQIPYCSDQDDRKNSWGDCHRFFRYKNPFLFLEEQLKMLSINFPDILIEKFKALKRMHPKEVESFIKSVHLDPTKDSQDILLQWKNFFSLLDVDSKFLQVDQNYPYVSLLNDLSRREDTYEFQKESMSKLSLSLKKIMELYVPEKKDDSNYHMPLISFLMEETNKKLDSSFQDVIDFSSLNLLKQLISKYYSYLERELLVSIPSHLPKILVKQMTETNYTWRKNEFLAPIEKMAKIILLSKSEDEDVVSPSNDYVFNYQSHSGQLRNIWIDYLSPAHYLEFDSYWKLRNEILKSHQTDLSNFLIHHPIEQLDSFQYNWLDRERKMFNQWNK